MAQEQIADKNTYLVVPFEEKDEAVKAAGKLPDGSNAITFDGDNKLWYAKPGADLSKVSQWAPDPAKANSTSAENDPRWSLPGPLRPKVSCSMASRKWTGAGIG